MIRREMHAQASLLPGPGFIETCGHGYGSWQMKNKQDAFKVVLTIWNYGTMKTRSDMLRSRRAERGIHALS